MLDEYELSHRHPTNITIHWIAEPLAIFALMALAASAPLLGITLLWPFLALTLGYFCWLSPRVTLAFLPIVTLFVILIALLDRTVTAPTWTWALPLFALSWVALLIGHKIETRVPTVFQNPNLIIIGPAWLMRRLFRRLNLRDP